MTLILRGLIQEARTTLASDSCVEQGHAWKEEGGRSCPQHLTDDCSQAVYRCVACGEYDYGAKGGPGYSDCEAYCTEKP